MCPNFAHMCLNFSSMCCYFVSMSLKFWLHAPMPPFWSACLLNPYKYSSAQVTARVEALYSQYKILLHNAENFTFTLLTQYLNDTIQFTCHFYKWILIKIIS